MTRSSDSSDIRYPITVQRAMLMLPLYVVMTARVRGQICVEALRSALEQVRDRHFLLGTRVEFNDDQTAYLTRANVPEFPIETVRTKDDTRWQRLVERYLSTPFCLETGPLVQMARKAHKRIHRRLEKENPFQQLILEIVHPGLVDSLYFQKLGFIDEKLSRRMLKVAHWHKEFYGCAITNVGRLDIPHTYGALTAEAVYGPVVYSDVNEKTIGVATAAGRLTLSMTTDGHRIRANTAFCVLTEALQQLRNNL